MVNFHQIALMSSSLLRIRTAPGTKNIPMLSMKNLLTSSMESTLMRPNKRKMNNKIIPINDPGKLTFAKDNRYEMSTPKREKAMIKVSCVKIFMRINYTKKLCLLHLCATNRVRIFLEKHLRGRR